MEKKAIIAEGITPPEQQNTKKAATSDLEDHTSKRLAEEAEVALGTHKPQQKERV